MDLMIKIHLLTIEFITSIWGAVTIAAILGVVWALWDNAKYERIIRENEELCERVGGKADKLTKALENLGEETKKGK